MISNRRLRNKPVVDAATGLALLLRVARAHLTQTRATVCGRCHHVLTRDQRLDMRCPGCAAKAAERDAQLP